MVAGNGDGHEIRPTGLLTRRSYPSAGRAVEAGCGTQIWGQARCPICRSGTFNVQLSTFNGVTERAYGGREWGQTRNSADRAFDRRTCPSAGRAVEAGCGAQIWGQARCSVLLISNVQRPTFNSQRSMGRPKGRMVAGICGQTRNSDDRAFDPPELPKRRSGGRGRLRHPDMGTGTMSDMPIRNVQRETFNSQLSTG